MDYLSAIIGNLRVFQMMLRHTPPEKLAACYRVLTGDSIENASMAAHARMRERLLTDAIERLEASRKDVSSSRDDNEDSD